MKINSRYVFIAVGIGIVAATLAVFYLGQKKQTEDEVLQVIDPQASTTIEQTQVEAIARAEPFEASLTEVMTSGKDYGCHYKTDTKRANDIGTVFISQGRVRGTVIGDSFGESGSLASFIINGERLYLWYTPEGMNESMQGKALLIDATNLEEKAWLTQDLMEDFSSLYGCVSWEFKEGYFELPTDIQFVDIGQGRV